MYEAISETTVAAAWLDKRNSDHLIGWLKPYCELNLTVLATLSDGEDAPNQRSQGPLVRFSPPNVIFWETVPNPLKRHRKVEGRFTQRNGTITSCTRKRK